MTKSIDAIVFDVDGVLINCFNSAGNFLWQENLESDLGISISETSEKLFKKYWPLIGSGKMDTLEAIDSFLKSIESNVSAKKFMDYWHQKDSNVNDQLYSVVGELKRKGYRLFIGTNQEKYRVKHIQKLLNREKTFEKIFASCEIGFEKPSRDFFVSVQRKLKIDASNILFIDDSKKNVEAAQRLNWKGYHYTNYDNFMDQIFAKL